MIMRSYSLASSRTRRRFSRLIVIPVGLWNVGIRYISFALGVAFRVFSSSSTDIPSSSIGTPTSVAPQERKELRDPIKLGLSHIMTSPSLQNTLQASSIPCCPPDTTSTLSSSLTILSPKRFFCLSAIAARKGAYPSVILYCRAVVDSFSKIF